MVLLELRRRVKLLKPDGKMVEISAVVDSGAAVSILTNATVNEHALTVDPLDNDIKLSGAFDTFHTDVVGSTVLQALIDDELIDVKFRVVNSPALKMNLLGWPEIQRLKVTIQPSGDILTPKNQIFGERIPTVIRMIKSDYQTESQMKVYHISTGDTATILTNGILTYTRGNHHIVSKDKPVVIEEGDALNHMSTIPSSNSNSCEIFTESEILAKIKDINSDISNSTLKKLCRIFQRHSSCLTKLRSVTGHVPQDDFVFHQSFTSEPRPVKQYVQNDRKKMFVQAEIKKLLGMNILEPTKAEVVTTQLLTVQKKSIEGQEPELRVVVDLRLVNLYTVPSNLLLISMDTILDTLKGHKYYIVLDIAKAFWAVSIPEAERKHYVVQCPVTLALFQLTRMPMGSRNASIQYQFFISSKVIYDMPDVLAYIDDIFIYGNCEKALLATFEKLMTRLVKFNLRVNFHKITKLMNSSCVCFGYLIGNFGLKLDPARVEALVNLKRPNTKKGLLAGVAAMNYFRRCIPSFSRLAANLYAMTHRDASFQWTTERISSWNELKNALIKHCTLARRIEGRPLVVQTDASTDGMGALLLQVNPDNSRDILSVFSKGVTGSMSRWHINALELRCISEALAHFESIIGYEKVHIETDSNYCFFMLSSSLDSVKITTRHPSLRDLSYISTYNFNVEHVSGQDNSMRLVDFISRQNQYEIVLARSTKLPILDITHSKTGEKFCENLDVNLLTDVTEADTTGTLNMISNKPLPSIDHVRNCIFQAQLDSSDCLKLKLKPEKVLNELHFKLKNQILYKITKYGEFLYCPAFYATTLMELLHRHESPRALINRIRSYKIFLAKLYSKVISFVSSCSCNASRHSRPDKSYSLTVNRPKFPMDTVCMDIWFVKQDIPVLSFVDHYSSFGWNYMLKDMTSNSVRRIILDFVTSFGLPNTLLTDNASNFNSSNIQTLLKSLGIVLRNSSAYNSRGNAACESWNSQMARVIRAEGSEPLDIEIALKIQAFKLNIERKVKGLSPFERFFNRSMAWSMLHGQKILNSNLPEVKNFEELRNKVSELTENILEERRMKYRPVKIKFRKGDYVRVKVFRTTNKKFKSPFSNSIYIIDKVHRNGVLDLTEIVTPGYQANQRRIHARFVKRVYYYPNVDQREDFVVDSAPSLVIGDDHIKETTNDTVVSTEPGSAEQSLSPGCKDKNSHVEKVRPPNTKTSRYHLRPRR